MTTGHVFIATSVDGFIARPDDRLDWLDQPGTAEEDHGYAAFLASVDGLVMGRRTYEIVRGFGAWPYRKPVVVLSRTLAGTPIPDDLAGRVRFWRETPRDTLDRLGDEGWSRAYVDGGRLIQTFLRDGLIADLTITRIPVLIGQGVPLFGRLPTDARLRHVETRTFPGGLVQSRYDVAA